MSSVLVLSVLFKGAVAAENVKQREWSVSKDQLLGCRSSCWACVVQEGHFKTYYKCPPLDLGHTVSQHTGFDGQKFNGVVMALADPMPPGLPYHQVELYSDTQIRLADFILPPG